MSPNKKVLFTLLSFVLAMVVIACSCSSLIPTATTQPDTQQETMPGLTGTWKDPETADTVHDRLAERSYVVTLSLGKEQATRSLLNPGQAVPLPGPITTLTSA